MSEHFAGHLVRHMNFASKHVDARHVEVWVPASQGKKPLPVLYMQDGQNLFHGRDSFAGVTWGVAETLTRLIKEESLPPAIVVGIWNTRRRIPEYMPQRPLDDWADPAILTRFSKTYGAKPSSDAYLRFMVDELKPFIDREYNTRPEAASSWLMGSSMGGLISLYAACEYPSVFSAACCLSTSWTIGGRVMIRYMERTLPPPGSHKLYFDYGGEAQIARYERLQQAANRVLSRGGYRREVNWMTRRFPGAAHDEAAWRARLDVPLRFLLESSPSDD